MQLGKKHYTTESWERGKWTLSEEFITHKVKN